MPVELVIDIDIKENYNSLLKEKVIIQDATKISFICKECNKKIIVKSFYNWRKRSGVFICGKCKTLKTKIDKYGSIENANAERQRKLEETNLKKYGVKNVFQLDDVKEKSKQTSLERYGCESPQSSDIVKQHQKETWQKTLGADNPFLSDECREKAKQTNIEKYGAESIFSVKSFQNKIQHTYEERYGCHPMKTKECKDKRKKTCLEKYGTTSPMGNDDIIKKMLKTKDENHSWGRRVYLYNGVFYDSSWEIMYVMFCEENNIFVKRNINIFLEYFDKNGKKHRYFPDFIAEDGHFIEIKGTHILGTNPFNLNDPSIGPKYKCMIDNNVEILSGEFFAPLLKKYPKRFFKKFRVN